MPKTAIIGGGLAGCECALALARSGLTATLFEMKPVRYSPAHQNPGLGELVCSNSLRSDDPQSAVGLLKVEMAKLGSEVLLAARAERVPAGKALAVDRDRFSDRLTQAVADSAGIEVIRREIAALSDPALTGFDRVVVAAGPLAAPDRSACRTLWVSKRRCTRVSQASCARTPSKAAKNSRAASMPRSPGSHDQVSP